MRPPDPRQTSEERETELSFKLCQTDHDLIDRTERKTHLHCQDNAMRDICITVTVQK